MSETRLPAQDSKQGEAPHGAPEILQPEMSLQKPMEKERDTQAPEPDATIPAASVAHVDVPNVRESEGQCTESIVQKQTDILQPGVRESESEKEDQHAADAIERGDRLALDAYEAIMAQTVSRALAGNIDAVREIRVGVIEPRRARISRKSAPRLSAVVLAALRQLPVKYTPPADAIDAEVIEPNTPTAAKE